ncbi:hypothetical protein F1559_004668 [Cyanidiococcus yangmingshanensis]|uniref:Uncharacterized protein n=1 Tax=Cyanidiococcus yangmingshanensis TaxID=2690220 RepID=A0A7J7INI6_9RHOD|nr:hypothetical protein F1559_004668 [Cyanidiococcus yangmingshanensis]
MVDRIANIVLCAENGALELDADRPEPMQLGLEDNIPPFLSLGLMERACRRSAFIRQSWISFQSPRAFMVFLVPVRQTVRDWQRMRMASRGHALDQSKEKLDTETIRLVCNDALFQEAVVCDMRRVLLRCQAIREDWFDALSWEIYFEPQLDETYFDLGFTPRNGLLSPAFDLKRGALYFHYAKQLGIPVPRASLERGTLLAEELDTDELAEELDTDEYEPGSGAEADNSGASGLQRWLLALWLTLRADLVDPLLNDDEAVQRPLWQRLFYRHVYTGNAPKLATSRGTEDAPRAEDPATRAESPQTAEALSPPRGQSPPQENRWIMRLLRPAWDPNRTDSAFLSRESAQCETESGTDPTCMPPLLSTRDAARRGRSKRTRKMHKKAYHEHDLPRWRFARFWNTLIPESSLEKFTPSADPDDILARDPLSAGGIGWSRNIHISLASMAPSRAADRVKYIELAAFSSRRHDSQKGAFHSLASSTIRRYAVDV